jgi:hypothetical protein
MTIQVSYVVCKNVHQYSKNLRERGTFLPVTHDRGRPRAVCTRIWKIQSWPTLLTIQQQAQGGSVQWKVSPSRLSGDSFTSIACIYITCNEYKAYSLMTTHNEWTSASGCCSNIPSNLVSHAWCLRMKQDSLGTELSFSIIHMRGLTKILTPLSIQDTNIDSQYICVQAYLGTDWSALKGW